MTLPKIRLTWDLNIGAIGQMITVAAAAMALYAIGLRFQWTTEQGLAASAAFQQKYTPVIDELKANDTKQTIQIDGINESVKDLNRIGIDSAEKLSDIATDVAVIKSKLEDKDENKDRTNR